jgi:hypothetical protein
VGEEKLHPVSEHFARLEKEEYSVIDATIYRAA